MISSFSIRQVSQKYNRKKRGVSNTECSSNKTFLVFWCNNQKWNSKLNKNMTGVKLQVANQQTCVQPEIIVAWQHLCFLLFLLFWVILAKRLHYAPDCGWNTGNPGDIIMTRSWDCACLLWAYNTLSTFRKNPSICQMCKFTVYSRHWFLQCATQQ